MESQCKRLIDYMMQGKSITQAEADKLFGIKRLASRISDLKDKGFGIYSSWCYGENRYGESCKWKSYSIVSCPEWYEVFNDGKISQ